MCSYYLELRPAGLALDRYNLIKIIIILNRSIHVKYNILNSYYDNADGNSNDVSLEMIIRIPISGRKDFQKFMPIVEFIMLPYCLDCQKSAQYYIALTFDIIYVKVTIVVISIITPNNIIVTFLRNNY